MKKNRIYPMFLPHMGCPHQCVYCNQHTVTKQEATMDEPAGLYNHLDLRLEQLADAAERSRGPGEIAFYGGTFTGLPSDLLRRLLDRSAYFIARGVFTGVRFSTRPDAITSEVCAFLAEYPITTVELGVQSLADEVLAETQRGYASTTVNHAVCLVKAHQWKMGIQLMVGLPGETHELFMQSASATVRLKPDFVRLYPTLVLPETVLAQWYRANLYTPLRLDDAVLRCACAFDMFLDAGIPVARMGLHADPELEKPGNIIAGPYHPAFGYLVKARRWRQQIDDYLHSHVGAHRISDLTLRVPENCLSEVTGLKRENARHWQNKWGVSKVSIEGVSNRAPGWFECFVDLGPD